MSAHALLVELFMSVHPVPADGSLLLTEFFIVVTQVAGRDFGVGTTYCTVLVEV